MSRRKRNHVIAVLPEEWIGRDNEMRPRLVALVVANALSISTLLVLALRTLSCSPNATCSRLDITRTVGILKVRIHEYSDDGDAWYEFPQQFQSL